MLILVMGLGLPSPGWAQSSGYSTEELDQLVGPIALYPDPLLDTIVAAAGQPDQIKAAAKTKSPNKSWDSSVQALCAYPDVLNMMAQNSEWTQGVGWAGANQVSEFMDAVQRFRFQTQSAGNLKSNDKMKVIEEGTTIRIESANPQVIYVPSYEPQTVVVEQDSNDDAAAVMAFGVGVATTALLWQNMYHWGGGAWYRPPYGWQPGVAHYSAYGWQGNGVYNRNNMVNHHTNINRPVNINNINTGNIRVNNGNRVNSGNRVNHYQNNQSTRVNQGNRVRPSDRPAVSQPGAWGGQQGLNGQRPSFPSQRPSFQPQNMPSQRPSLQSRGEGSGFSNYSRAGSTSRESSRGAYSRGSQSYSGGGRSRGGGRRR